MSVWSVVWDSIPGRSTCNPKADLRGPCRLTGLIHCTHSWLVLASMLLQGSLCPALKRCIIRPGSVAIIPHYCHICCTHSNQKICISLYIECRQPCTKIKLVMWSIYVRLRMVEISTISELWSTKYVVCLHMWDSTHSTSRTMSPGILHFTSMWITSPSIAHNSQFKKQHLGE